MGENKWGKPFASLFSGLLFEIKVCVPSVLQCCSASPCGKASTLCKFL